MFGKASSTFRRDAVISNGTLKLSAGSVRIGNAASALGSTEISHTTYIESGATLYLATSDLFGQFYNNPTGVAIYVRGGTIKQDHGLSNTFGPLVLEDATLTYGGGAWDSNTSSRWPTFGFSDVTFRGSTTSVKQRTPEEIKALTKEEMTQIIKDTANVGLGGSSFPTYIKFQTDKKIDLILINGIECEPYITADHRLMLEFPYRIMDAITYHCDTYVD